MRTRLALFAVIFAIPFLIPLPTHAQTRIIRQDTSGTRVTVKGDLFRIPEIGAFVVQSGTDLEVDQVMPPGQRPKGYDGVDVRQGDRILMVNARRVKSPRDLETQYKAVPVGGEVKLGLQRGSEMFLASFRRADPKDLPQVRTMMIRTDGKEDMRPLPELGIVLQETKTGVRVQSLLHGMDENSPKFNIKEGDVVKRLNGTTLRTLKDFARVYDGIHAGEKIAWAAERGNQSLSFSFPKPEARGTVIMKQRSQP